ncbi:DUF2752 domain-containing protein [Nocardioides sp.]|uniref:DUF2752 domain-containing protein n=1 Tax=Nocardioides sp. TaxID=35761 RepID=UPI00263947BC|nr:DUF2752 domain-containing protein [Nocardioides sp.]
MASARVERLRAPTLTIAALAAATGALHLRDPHRGGSWGLCPFNALTGLSCPGCGGLRAVNDLSDGHVGAALSSNLLVTVGIPVAVVALLIWVVCAWRDAPFPRLEPRTRQAVWLAIAAVVVVFSVARNLPAGSWLAP